MAGPAVAESPSGWDERDLVALLTLDAIGPGRFRTRHGDPNENGRSYGGQLLGQAMAAACQGMAGERRPSMMQLAFLQGADPAQPIDFEVTTLQAGRRFTTRHVRGRQADGRTVVDAQVSFAVPIAGPTHAALPRAAPWGLAPPMDFDEPECPIPSKWETQLRRWGGYSFTKPSLLFHVPDAAAQLAPPAAEARLCYWLRAREPLPDDPLLHVAAFAYLSDWWLNFSSLGVHVGELRADERAYVASLNHAVWLHRPFRADEWFYVETESPSALAGRALSVARVYDAEGRLVASATQESLLSLPREPAEPVF